MFRIREYEPRLTSQIIDMWKVQSTQRVCVCVKVNRMKEEDDELCNGPVLMNLRLLNDGDETLYIRGSLILRVGRVKWVFLYTTGFNRPPRSVNY